MKRQIMKMKYITPAITIMETVMETNLLDGSIQKNGESVLPGEGKKVIDDTKEEVNMGSKGYNSWEAWDEF